MDCPTHGCKHCHDELAPAPDSWEEEAGPTSILISVAEAAARLGVSRARIRQLVKGKRLLARGAASGNGGIRCLLGLEDVLNHRLLPQGRPRKVS